MDLLGPPARCPFTVSFLGEGFPTKVDYRKQGALILTSLLEDLAVHLETLVDSVVRTESTRCDLLVVPFG